MISAVSSSISTYQAAQRAAMPVVTQVDTALVAEKHQEMTRDDAKAQALTDARQKFLQTEYTGPARIAARLMALGQSHSQALQSQYVGPARAEARLMALGAEQTGTKGMKAYYQDLRSGCHAGPKPASTIAAEDRYRLALAVFG